MTLKRIPIDLFEVIRGLTTPRAWAPMAVVTLVSFLLGSWLECLGFFAPWSFAIALFSFAAWPLSFEVVVWQRAMQSLVFFGGFAALFFAVQVCYLLTRLRSIAWLVFFLPPLYLLFAALVLGLLWPLVFFLSKASGEELVTQVHALASQPRRSLELFALAFAPLGISGLLLLWGRQLIFATYGEITPFTEVAALWPFLAAVSLSAAFFLRIAQVKRGGH